MKFGAWPLEVKERLENVPIGLSDRFSGESETP
jgi:hypothetical protein